MSKTSQPPRAVADPPRRLHLGAGNNYREGWHNVDISEDVNPDVVMDLDDRGEWSALPGEYFEVVEARHVLEHLEAPVMAMEEVTRVLEPGGRAIVTVPTGINSRTDPTHENYWTWKTPEYFTADGPYSWEAGCDLEIIDRRLSMEAHGPTRGLTPLVDKLAEFWPLWTADLPGTSGELTVIYRKREAEP